LEIYFRNIYILRIGTINQPPREKNTEGKEMVEVTQLAVAQTLETTPEGDIQFVVRGYSWRPFLGFHLPHIDTISHRGLGSAPLFGEHTLTLTKEHYCLECLRPTPGTSHCEECAQLPKVQRMECITKGAGTPYNQPCDPNNPPCESAWAAQYCADEHVIYIAGFGEVFKVGVTRARRWNDPDGYRYRLIEQGADCATVLAGELDLPSAQYTEQLIADTLGLESRVGFHLKAEEFTHPAEPHLETLRELKEQVLQRFHLREVCTLDLSHAYGVLPGLAVDDACWEIGDLVGRVVYVRGNVVYLESNGYTVAHDLHSLRGRGIICEED